MFGVAGIKNCATDKSFTDAGRLCLQNIWTWQEVRQPDNIYHVSADHIFQHLDATLLLPLRLQQVRDLPRSEYYTMVKFELGSGCGEITWCMTLAD